jgi:carboxypeptidase family protein
MRLKLLGVASMFAVPHGLVAQGSTFFGRVLTDSGVPLAGVEVVLRAKRTNTNAKGEFKLASLTAGEHLVLVRMPGFAPKTDTIEVADAGEARREYRLSRVQATLPEVPVITTLTDRRLAEFYNRQQFGMGRFMDSAQFANAHGIRTAEKLMRLPGLLIQRGKFSDAYVISSRGRCAASVWMDGLNLGTGFDVNSLDPGIILAIEWYPTAAMTPVQFSMVKRGASHCAAIVIWTK